MSTGDRLADRWARPGSTPDTTSTPTSADRGAVRQRSVHLPAPVADALGAAAAAGRSNGEIIAAAHLECGHLVTDARPVRVQRTFFLPDGVVDEIDAAAAAAGGDRSDYVAAVLAIALAVPS